MLRQSSKFLPVFILVRWHTYLLTVSLPASIKDAMELCGTRGRRKNLPQIFLARTKI